MQSKTCDEKYTPIINPFKHRAGYYQCIHCGQKLKHSDKSKYVFYCTCPWWNKNMRLSIG